MHRSLSLRKVCGIDLGDLPGELGCPIFVVTLETGRMNSLYLNVRLEPHSFMNDWSLPNLFAIVDRIEDAWSKVD